MKAGMIGLKTLDTPSARKPATPARLLAKWLLILMSILVAPTQRASATDPLGATLHSDGTTTFRVWAPFVDNVGVKIDGGAVPLAQEPGHTDPADTTWIGTVPGTKAGDPYRYVIGWAVSRGNTTIPGRNNYRI